ncbi:hypothetical protein D6C98_09454 [Aureobasidium pullulans]|nr:hypothetical protein D6C98_09454 [Aureobasidium pullulans]
MHPCPSHPTRIILRVHVKDFDGNGFSWYHYPTAIETYLRWAGRSLDDWKQRKHNIFVEPLQDPEVKQKIFHIIIDLNSLSFQVEDMNAVQHELYEIKRRDDETLTLRQAKSPIVAQNIISKTRFFTDKSYPWGSEAWDQVGTK